MDNVGCLKVRPPVSVGKCFKDDEPRVRCVARERFVKLSKRGANSGPGSPWFVIQSVSLCPGPQGSNDDPLACFFFEIHQSGYGVLLAPAAGVSSRRCANYTT